MYLVIWEQNVRNTVVATDVKVARGHLKKKKKCGVYMCRTGTLVSYAQGAGQVRASARASMRERVRAWESAREQSSRIY